MKIRVQIGGGAVEFEVWQTTAPAAYDSGGTFTIEEGGAQRIVAIRAENVEWQRARYWSGVYGSTPLEEWAREHVEEMLWSRLMRAEVE